MRVSLGEDTLDITMPANRFKGLENEPDDVPIMHSISVNALAHYGEIFGYSDVIDTVEALVRVKETEFEHGGEVVPVDPVSKENAWTQPLALLKHLEQAREDEALAALAEGTEKDPRSPRLRAALRVQAESARLGGEGRNKRAELQASLRWAFGCRDPDRAPTVVRGSGMTADPAPHTAECAVRRRIFSDEERCEIRAVVAPLLELLRRERAEYLHRWTSHESDPLGEAYDPAESEDIMQRLGREFSASSPRHRHNQHPRKGRTNGR